MLVLKLAVWLAFAFNGENLFALGDLCGGTLCDKYIASMACALGMNANETFLRIVNETRSHQICKNTDSLENTEGGSNSQEEELGDMVKQCSDLFSDYKLHVKLNQSGISLATNKLYWRSSTRMNQSQGQDFCRRISPQANLAKMENVKERKVLTCFGIGYLWIGIKYRKGSWTWEDGSTTSYLPWYSGTGNCTTFHVGHWHWFNCTRKSLVFCYVNVTKPTKPAPEPNPFEELESVADSIVEDSTVSSDNVLAFEKVFEDLAGNLNQSTLRRKIGKVLIDFRLLNATAGQVETGLIRLDNGSAFESRFTAGNGSKIALTAFTVSENSTSNYSQMADDNNEGSTNYFVSPSSVIFTGVTARDLTRGSILNGSISLSVKAPQGTRNEERVCEVATAVSSSSSISSTLADIQPTCVFIERSSGAYSTFGCRTVVNGSQVFCHCDHHTVFAVLLAVRMVAIPQALKILTYACESVSVLFLGLTIALLLIHKREIDSDRTLIQINISSALLLLHLVNMIHDAAVNNDTTCIILAAAIHYFLLASGFWFMIDGIRMMMAFAFPARFRAQDPVKRSVVFLVLGWSLPALIVASALTVGLLFSGNYMTPSVQYLRCSHVQQNLRKYDRCWLAPGTLLYILSVAVPLGAIMVVNFCASLTAAYAALPFRRREERRPGKEMENAQRFIASFVFVMLVLGASWVLGFLTGIGNEVTSLVLTYVHTSVNGLQGVAVFFFYCYRNSTISSALLRSRNRQPVVQAVSYNKRTQSVHL